MATYPTGFSKWGTDMVHRVFGLNDVKKHQSLIDWMNYNPPSVEGGDLALLQLSFERYHSRARYLSESDMKMKVLGPAIVASGIDNKGFSTFGEVLIKTALTQDLIDVTMRIRALKYIIGGLIGITSRNL
jgi:hypothetical protein